MGEFYMCKMLRHGKEEWYLFHCKITELRNHIDTLQRIIASEGVTSELLAIKQVTQTYDIDISKI